MSDPVNPPAEPPFNLVQAIKAQPNPTDENWNRVRDKKKRYANVFFENLSNKSQLAALMTEDGVLQRIIVSNGYSIEFNNIMSHALQNWNAANAANPIQGSLAEVYKEVADGHQEEPLF